MKSELYDMVILYLIINLILIGISRVITKKWINPINIYLSIFTVSVTLYDMNLSNYYPLTYYTWLIIIIFNVSFYIGYIFSTLIKRKYRSTQQIGTNINRLEKATIVLTLLGFIGVLSNYIPAFNKYGFHIYKYTNELYTDRLLGRIQSGIPYLDSLLYLAITTASMIFIKTKKIRYMILPISLIVVESFISAGRNDLIIAIIFLISPFIANGLRNTFKRKQLFNLTLLMSLIITVFFLLTSNRITVIPNLNSDHSILEKLIRSNGVVYKTYLYLSGPIGVLNQFLINPTFNFGGHTFLSIYNILNRLGFDINVSQYQEFYNIGINNSSNVGTYVRELIEDFGLFASIMINLLLGYFTSLSYLKAKKEPDSIMSTTFFAVFMNFVILSFYMLVFRQGTYLVVVISSIILKFYVETNKINKKEANTLNII